MMWQGKLFIAVVLLTNLEALKHGGAKGQEKAGDRSRELTGLEDVPASKLTGNKNRENGRSHGVGEPVFFSRKDLHGLYSSTTSPGLIGEGVAVEQFVETLMTNERYLNLVESLNQKLSNLNVSFQERTDSILKHVDEMMHGVMKRSPADGTWLALQTIKEDLERLKVDIVKRNRNSPGNMEGSEFHLDAALDTRLSTMENQMRNIMAGVESIVSTIAEVKSRQYTRTYQKNGDSAVSDSMTLVNEFRRALHEQKSKRCECKSMGRVDRSERYPTDCHEIQMQGFNVSGIYKIKPDDLEPFYVLCDLGTAGGGWTVLQNRFDGTQDFFKGWSEYKNGFGNLAAEFWLGLEKVNALTNQKLYELRVEVETQHGAEAYAGYSVFTVGPEYEGYRISTLGTYYGTAGDSLSYHAGQKFSTFDTDNDEWKDGACAIEHGGAWWYKECDKSNLNGKYSTTADEHRGQSIYWISFKGPNLPLAKTKMMIRPLPASRPNDLVDQSRKILEGTKMDEPEKRKGFHSKNLKASYDATASHPAYKYDEVADAFFPNFE